MLLFAVEVNYYNTKIGQTFTDVRTTQSNIAILQQITIHYALGCLSFVIYWICPSTACHGSCHLNVLFKLFFTACTSVESPSACEGFVRERQGSIP